jgi:hypothetical protein
MVQQRFTLSRLARALMAAALGVMITNAAGAQPFGPPASGFVASAGSIDITQYPYYGVCDGVTDISNLLVAAVATGRMVYLPSTTSGHACVFENIVLSNIAGGGGITGNGTFVRPAPTGANWLVELTGRNQTVTGLVLEDTNANLLPSRVGAYTTLGTTMAAGSGTWSGGIYTNTLTTSGTTTGGSTLQVGQRFELRLDDGGYLSGRITSVSGTSVGIQASNNPLTSATSGNFFGASFGMIYVSCGARFNNIQNITGAVIHAGIYLDCPSGAGEVENTIQNISFQVGARLFGVICSANCSANYFDKLYLNGGWYDTFTATGDGSTTSFTDGERQPIAPSNAATTYDITVSGSTCSSNPCAWPTDFAVTNHGQNIVFTTPPALGAAVSIARTIFTPEGTISDPAGAGSAAGNNWTNLIVGSNEMSFAFRGASIDNYLAIANLGPGTYRGFLADTTTGTLNFLEDNIDIGGIYFNAAEIVTNTATTSIIGSLTAEANAGSDAADGVTGMNFAIDPAASFTGLVWPSTFGAPMVYTNGALVTLFGAPSPSLVTAVGTCTVNGAVAQGTIVIPCSATTGSIVAGQADLTDTTYFTGGNRVLTFTGSTVYLTSRTLAALTNGTVLTFGPPSLPSADVNSINVGIWGTGVDGNSTVSTSKTATRDGNYNNLTMASGGSLNIAGSVTHVAGTLDLTNAPAGAIYGYNTTANAASGAAGGAAKGPSAGVGTQLAAGANGSAGGTGNITTGTNPGTASAAGRGVGGDGGGGGTGGTGVSAGATGATAGAIGLRYQFPNPTTSYVAALGTSNSVSVLVAAEGGSGGGQGGGDGLNAGGGGGGGGPGADCVLIFAHYVKRGPNTAASAIRALGNAGGAGASGVAGNAGGGGGGGGSGGGCILVVTEQLLGSTAANALDVTAGNGGAGGAGSGTGAAGGGGVAGKGGSTQVLVLGTSTFTANTANLAPSSAPSGTTGGVAATAQSGL